MTRAPRARLALAAALALTVVVAPSRAPVQAAPPAERVLLVTDSVGLGARGALQRAFPAHWEVNVIGEPARFVEQLESQFVRPTMALNPWMVGDHVVIAGGYNYPYWDPARFDRSIDSIINTLVAGGVENVYWVTLREVKPQYISASAWRQVQPYYWYFPTVNQHLHRALLRHPNLTLVDWAAVADQPGITYDAIHLNTTGAALYSNTIAAAVHNANTWAPNGTVSRVHVTDDPTVEAAALNLTTTGTRRSGFFAAYACDGPRPGVSNLNHGRAHTVAAAAIVPVGPDGDVCVYNHQAGQVIVDVYGTFGSGADLGDGPPTRLLDTRTGSSAGRVPAGTTRSIHLGVPPDTAAVAINVTAVDAVRRGHATVHPCAVPKPDTSNLNFRPGVNTPNLALVEPDGDGNVCITATADVHLLVDRFAVFGPGSGATVTPPARVLDTRTDGSTPAAGRVVSVDLSGHLPDTGSAPAGGVVVNLTIADPQANGFATIFGCAAGRPQTSNINVAPGVNLANLAVVQPDVDGRICVYTHTAAEVVVDLLGATGGGFSAAGPLRLLDTRG